MKRNFKFELKHKDKKCYARRGSFTTYRGVKVETPVFMPVGTQATLKGINHRELKNFNINMMLSNSYHLYLRPGLELIEEAGGLHDFMNYDGSILTDSGGFQVFSLAKLMKITDEGINLRSHIDGSKHFYTPELVVEINRVLKPDIMMVLDECSPYEVSRKKAEKALIRTTKWAIRAKEAIGKYSDEEFPSEPFCIVQGAFDKDLRTRSLEELMPLGFKGMAIGGLSVGEPKELMVEVLQHLMPQVPQDVPRYLMGVGSVAEMLNSVELGIDMFDCVLPTRIGRHGTLLLPKGKINLKNSKWKKYFGPAMEDCDCPLCSNFTLAYVSHLIRAKEMFGGILCSLHNIRLLYRIMEEARLAIEEDRFVEYKNSILN